MVPTTLGARLNIGPAEEARVQKLIPVLGLVLYSNLQASSGKNTLSKRLALG